MLSRRVNTCRGLRDLSRLYRESAARREAIAQLPIDKERDLIVCVGGILTISNATISAHSEAEKVLSVAEKVYRDLTRVGERTRYRFTTSGWLQNRIVEPMAGLNRTLHFKPRINPGGDGARAGRLQKKTKDFVRKPNGVAEGFARSFSFFSFELKRDPASCASQSEAATARLVHSPNVSARGPCRSQPRACAAQRSGSQFLPPFARATCADAYSADNQQGRCVSPGRHGWKADSIF